MEEFINQMLSLGEDLSRCINQEETDETYKEARILYENHLKAINYTQPDVSNNEVALKAFVEEFVEAWEDGMCGDTDLYRKAKSLL